jgi:hypothetical protein
MTAAHLPQRSPRLTRGWVELPVSLVENQALLTPAELRFALIVLRRPDQTVSDSNWERWTGLDPRSKENAVRGLRQKCVTVHGRGNNAKYRFDGALWPKFVTESARGAVLKARTAGRGVSPKKNAKVHPQCRETGCALLNSSLPPSDPQNELSLVPPSPNTKLVSRSGEAPASGAADKPAASGLVKVTLESDKRALLATENAKQVSRNSGFDAAEQIWAGALGALQAIFPLVGLAFLVRLVSVVRAVFSDITDSELADAIGFAWRAKRSYQTSEGLFIWTVPAAVRALRRLPKSPPGSEIPDCSAGVRLLLQRAKEGIEARGAPLAEIAAAVSNLLGRVDETADWGAIDQEMQAIEGRLLSVVESTGLLKPAERNAVEDCVEARIDGWRGKVTKVRLDEIRGQALKHETLKVLMIPRLSTFYA